MIDQRPSNADANGFVIEEETVSIKIPAGVEDEMQLKVSGKGNAAPGNGISGDLLVAISEAPHPNYKERVTICITICTSACQMLFWDPR